MRRRDFIGLAAALTAVPHTAAAQAGRTRVVGVLLSQTEGSDEAKDRVAAIREGLQKLGWTEGRNLRLDVRYGEGNAARMGVLAAELTRSEIDVLFASATTALSWLQKTTSTVPIVFAQVTDPVGAGFVQSLARPGGNITGFTQHEFSIGVKWLELLKELAPLTERAAVIFDPANPATAGYLTAIKAGASQLRVQVSAHPVRNPGEIEQALVAIAGRPNSGFFLLPGPAPSVQRDLIVSLASRHRLPAVYPFRYWVTGGGLAFYGVDNIELHRAATSYVDRILKGEKPADLPIQHATKFELVINMKTARALGLDPPNSLLARTDEVIE